VSLDIVRGLTVVIMILVNNGPHEPPPEHFPHAAWNGLGLADVVMPFFLFMVGTSIALAFRDGWPGHGAGADEDEDDADKARARPTAPPPPKRWDRVRRVLVRTVKMFALGLLCQGLRSTVYPFPYVDLTILRIMGVLQRIAIVYVITALAFLFVPPLPLRGRPRTALGRALDVLVRYLPLWLVGAVFSAAYNAVMFALFVPSRYLYVGDDAPPIYVECDTVGNLTETCNAADYVDSLVRTTGAPPLIARSCGVADRTVERPLLGDDAPHQVLGNMHMYLPAVPHEPEGLMSTASAMGSAFAGLYFGIVLLRSRRWQRRVAQWGAATALLTVAGVVLALYGGVPINKKLYTTSYMLLTAGMAGGVLTFVYLTADVVGHCVVRALYFPFMCVGMNAIMIYVGDSLLWPVVNMAYYEVPSNSLYYVLRDGVAGLVPDAHNGLILWAACDCVLWTVVAVVLWRKRVFFKV